MSEGAIDLRAWRERREAAHRRIEVLLGESGETGADVMLRAMVYASGGDPEEVAERLNVARLLLGPDGGVY